MAVADKPADPAADEMEKFLDGLISGHPSPAYAMSVLGAALMLSSIAADKRALVVGKAPPDNCVQELHYSAESAKLGFAILMAAITKLGDYDAEGLRRDSANMFKMFKAAGVENLDELAAALEFIRRRG